jgi:GT2 family glycosyltransferase
LDIKNNSNLKVLWKLNHESTKEILIGDGVFMASKKAVWEKTNFDEMVKGFHCYDLAFSMDLINNGYKNYFINDILITHLSGGTLNKDFFESNFVVRRNRYYKLYHNKFNNIGNFIKTIESDSLFNCFQGIWGIESIKFKDKISLVIKYFFWSFKFIGVVDSIKVLNKFIFFLIKFKFNLTRK